MPRLDDHSLGLLRVGHRVGHSAHENVKRVWAGFLNFAARDNVLEVALGLM